MSNYSSSSEDLASRETPTPEVLERLMNKNAQFYADVLKLADQMKLVKMDQKDLKEQESILTAIQGSWTIVYSIGMEEFIDNWKKICNFPDSSVYPALFEMGVMHFDFNPETQVLKTKETLGSQAFCHSEGRLGEQITVENGVACSSVIRNSLVTICFKAGEEFCRIERFMKDGRLHIVNKRFGLECERVYKKVGDEHVNPKLQEKIKSLEETNVKLLGEMTIKDHKIDTLKVRLEEEKETVQVLEDESLHFQGLVDHLRLRKKELKLALNAEAMRRKILGTWKLIPSEYAPDLNTLLVFKHAGNAILEMKRDSDEVLHRWEFDIEDYMLSERLLAHTYIEPNQIVSDLKFVNGQDLAKIRRTIESDGKLRMTTTKGTLVSEYLFEKQK